MKARYLMLAGLLFAAPGCSEDNKNPQVKDTNLKPLDTKTSQQQFKSE